MHSAVQYIGHILPFLHTCCSHVSNYQIWKPFNSELWSKAPTYTHIRMTGYINRSATMHFSELWLPSPLILVDSPDGAFVPGSLAVVHIRDDVIILRWCHRTIGLKHLHPTYFRNCSQANLWDLQHVDALLDTPNSTGGSKQRTCWTAHTHTLNHIDARLLKVRPHAKWERSREVSCLHIYMSVIQLSQYTRCTCRPTLVYCIHRCVHRGYTRTTSTVLLITTCYYEAGGLGYMKAVLCHKPALHKTC